MACVLSWGQFPGCRRSRGFSDSLAVNSPWGVWHSGGIRGEEGAESGLQVTGGVQGGSGYSQTGHRWARVRPEVAPHGPLVRERPRVPGHGSRCVPPAGLSALPTRLQPVPRCATCPSARGPDLLDWPNPPALQGQGACTDSETLCSSFPAAVLEAGSVISPLYR